jgi:hypothetical protein
MKTLSVLILAVVCFSTSIFGQEEFTHQGFYMRFLAGGGPGRVKIDNDMILKSSPAGLFHFQIGGALTENLALFADLGGFSLTDPEMEYGGSTTPLDEASVSSVGIGAGLSYYIMPANLYLSGSLMLAQVSMEFEGTTSETEWGPGFLVAVGKEWRVGRRWGLGAAAFFEGAKVKDQADPGGNQPDVTSSIFGIAFTATLF